MYQKGRLSVKRKNENRKRTLLHSRDSNDDSTELIVSIDKSIWVSSPAPSVTSLKERLTLSSYLPQGIIYLCVGFLKVYSRVGSFSSPKHMYVHCTIVLLGWVRVRELAFSKVKEDADGIVQLSRTVVVGDDMTWHVQVCVREFVHHVCVLCVDMFMHTCAVSEQCV